MTIRSLFRALPTLLVLAVAIILAYFFWNHYMYSPWTRDGRVRANVISLAPDVSGIVTEVRVKDNQVVHRGDILFTIDRQRFDYALAQAEAQVAQQTAERTLRQHQASRRANLGQAVVSAEAREQAAALARQAEAGYAAALAARDLARLNVERSVIRAPTDGYITNLNLFPGDYATAGVAKMALIERDSYWVYAYFEETKLQGVRVGDQAEIRLLAGGSVIRGHVQSIARGISDQDSHAGNNLLADVNPVFTWIRLAQRIPVRIHLDHVPKDQILMAGTTCTVTILH